MSTLRSANGVVCHIHARLRLGLSLALSMSGAACAAELGDAEQAQDLGSVELALDTNDGSDRDDANDDASSPDQSRLSEHERGTRKKLSKYETVLPHTTQPELSAYERRLLVRYLDHPSKLKTVVELGNYHLQASLGHAAFGGEAVRHSIFALYFLNRAKDLGSRSRELDARIAGVESALNAVFQNGAPITSDEYQPAHVFYRRTFHFNEEWNRYEALTRLLEEIAGEPRNVYTAFAITALNLWVGGEADYDDPTTLYNFVLGSFFSRHTITLAHAVEDAWNLDPNALPRFRMAATLGGFGLLQRRWLALLHGDQQAVALIDDEHRQWYAIQPAFHSFPLGLPFFDEPENFAEGYEIYASGVPACSQIPVRTCSDLPRFRFNMLGFVLGQVDYALKAGDLDVARGMLKFRLDPSQQEAWNSWTIGREPWLHRERNFDALAALYANDKLSDDPVNFEMKSRKWGEDTTTCLECHTIQAAPVSFDVVNEPQLLPPEVVASVRAWPAFTTAWYGAQFRVSP